MGVPFVPFCLNAGIRITYTASDTPQQNAPAESANKLIMMGATTCRRGVAALFGVTDFMVVHGRDRWWMESVRYICECFNRSSTEANQGNTYHLRMHITSGLRPVGRREDRELIVFWRASCAPSSAAAIDSSAAHAAVAGGLGPHA